MQEEYIQIMGFPCDCCGQCCMNLSNSPLYGDLDDGHGICRYFNIKTHLCSIYERRPVKCNIDAMYDKYFSMYMSREEYYSINIEACNGLKEQARE